MSEIYLASKEPEFDSESLHNKGHMSWNEPQTEEGNKRLRKKATWKNILLDPENNEPCYLYGKIIR